MTERLEPGGATAVEVTWIAMHVRDLVEARADLHDKTARLQEIKNAVELAESTS